jgi:tRNA(fMet)-specific endonuclease VapC
MYLIDTDILVSLGRGNVNIQARMSRAGINNCVLSEISLAELYVGFYKSPGKDNLLEFIEKHMNVIPITQALKTYALIRARLENDGNRLEDNDIFIAATALVNDYTLVTHNTRHFSRIPNLKLEDWIEE